MSDCYFWDEDSEECWYEFESRDGHPCEFYFQGHCIAKSEDLITKEEFEEREFLERRL